MNAFLKKTIQSFRIKKGVHTLSYKNPVLFHWKLLLGLFLVLLLGVGVTGFFLYEFFIVQKEATSLLQNEKGIQFDEKKLKGVIERIEKRQTSTIEVATGTSRFIDPSIPF